MSNKYDVVVIGAGPGGYVAAIRCAQLRLKTAIVEREYMGGVCLNWGCIPSKTLLHVTEMKRKLEQAGRIGLSAENVSIDIKKLRRHKDATVKRLTGGVKLLLEKAGVTIIDGSAEFMSPTQVRVTGGKSEIDIQSENFIVATGATPISLPMLPHDGNRIIGAREAISLPDIPPRMLVVGAGPIGVEMATVYQTLGSEVKIVEVLDSVLPTLDSDISAICEKSLTKQGMTILTSSRVTGSTVSDSSVSVSIESDGKTTEEKFDKVLVAAGMIPNSSSLNLQGIGVKLDSRGFVTVDKRMCSSVSNIYAIGDVAGGMLLAHKASHEGIVAAEVIAGAATTADWKAVPYAVFGDPEVAGVGMTEREAETAGHKVKIGKFPYQAVGKAVATLATEGFAKIIADADTDELLGVHIIGPHAGDIVYTGTAMLEMDATASDLAHTMGVHPTLSEALAEAALNADKRAIHIPN